MSLKAVLFQMMLTSLLEKKIMIVYSAEISGLRLATDSGISVCIEIQWTPDDSNVQGKSKTVRVIEISKLKNQK